MRAWFFSVWAGAWLGACQMNTPQQVEAPADSTAGEFALEWAGPNRAAVVVPVHINGSGPYRFVVDTGASLTCVANELAAELALPASSGRIAYGAGVGGAGRMRLVRIDSLRVGPARVEELTACTLNLSAARRVGVEFDGLLGLNFLRSFRVVLDFEREMMTLQRP